MASEYLVGISYMAGDSLNEFCSCFTRLINRRLYGGSFCQQKRLYGGSGSALAVKLSISIHPIGLVYDLATNRRIIHFVVDLRYAGFARGNVAGSEQSMHASRTKQFSIVVKMFKETKKTKEKYLTYNLGLDSFAWRKGCKSS